MLTLSPEASNELASATARQVADSRTIPQQFVSLPESLPTLPTVLPTVSDVHDQHVLSPSIATFPTVRTGHLPIYADGASTSRQGPLHDFTSPPNLSGLPTLANAANSRRLSFAPSINGTSPLDAATTETLERQPREATGYEWDERHHSMTRASDGTACLSVEPDGDGYLGMSRQV